VPFEPVSAAVLVLPAAVAPTSVRAIWTSGRLRTAAPAPSRPRGPVAARERPSASCPAPWWRGNGVARRFRSAGDARGGSGGGL